jgi:ubiquitin thioesterase OTU1
MPFVRRRIAPDGSCLFASIDLLTARADSDEQERADAPQQLRAHVAATILAQPDTYTEALLGSPPDEYTRWIQSPHNYGGENEITILAQLKQVEVCVVMLSTGALLPYAPAQWLSDDAARERVYIFFTGGELGANHYDAIVDESSGRRRFPADGSAREADGVRALAAAEKARRELELRTRVRKRVRCGECGAVMRQDEFQTHCAEVEHSDDFDYACDEIEVEELVASAADD